MTLTLPELVYTRRNILALIIKTAKDLSDMFPKE